MKFEPITIKDIARALGLSTSTVSRALRDSYEISTETKKLVTEYAVRMNYRPNPVALSLKERRSKSIGIVVSEIANSFFSQAINGIESVAHDNGYNVIISQTHESYQKEIDAVNHLASRSVDGLLVSLSSETTDISHLRDLHEKGLPIVFFDRVTDELPTHRVISDNYQGAYDATHHLITNGYDKIAFIGNAGYLSIMQERLSGYKAALSDKNVPYQEKYVKFCLHGGLVHEEVEDALEQVMVLDEKPNALLGCSDKITTHCFRYCKERSIKVPHDVALVGFSNLDLTELLQPSLSVIRQHAFKIGEMAADLMIQLLESKRPVKQFEKKYLPTELMVRASSAI